MPHSLFITLTTLILISLPTTSYCADNTSSSCTTTTTASPTAVSDGVTFLCAALSSTLNIPDTHVTEGEAYYLNQAGKDCKKYATFKKLYADGDIATVTRMLGDNSISSGEAGLAIINLPPQNIEEIACAQEIAKVYPYALWDGAKIHSSYFDPYFESADAKRYLDLGLMIPYLKRENRAHCFASPILHYFLIWRDTKITPPNWDKVYNPDKDNLKPVDYETIARLLKSGFNPHFKDYSWQIREKEDAYLYVQNTIIPEEGPKLKALLDQYAQKPDKNGVYNTTDMFYPGTKFYRAPKQ